MIFFIDFFIFYNSLFFSGMKKIPLNTVGILKDYELNTYLDDKLAPQTRFCTRLSRDAIMKWQSCEISSPLTKILNDSYHEIATSIFNRKINIIFNLKNLNV